MFGNTLFATVVSFFVLFDVIVVVSSSFFVSISDEYNFNSIPLDITVVDFPFNVATYLIYTYIEPSSFISAS